MGLFTKPVIARGDIWALVRISFPFFLFLFCESLTVFGEYIFLSYSGVEVLSGALNGMYLAFIFQSPCIAIASMTQVFVGFYQGKGELKKIGPCVWQLIWFSFLSLAITLPLSFWCSSFYFKGSPIEQMGIHYFNILNLGNFLFPLSTTLTSFYFGRGKTTLVTTLLLASYAFNLMLCWLLVFGINGFIPALGIRGAALAKCLSMGLFCLILSILFLNKKNRELYGTNDWQFSPIAFWSYLYPGLMRGFAYLGTRTSWAAISYLMIKKGEGYLDVQMVGGTIIAFLVFIPAGIYRSFLTLIPNLLGAKQYSEIWRLCRSLLIYTLFIGGILAVFLLIYPGIFIHFFDASSKEVYERTFNKINYWVWLFLITSTMQMGLCGFLVAVRDLKVQFYCYLLSFLTSLFPVYLILYVWEYEPNKLWLIMALESLFMAIVFFYRLRQKKWEERQFSAYLK